MTAASRRGRQQRAGSRPAAVVRPSCVSEFVFVRSWSRPPSGCSRLRSGRRRPRQRRRRCPRRRHPARPANRRSTSNRLITLALEHNPSLEAARHRVAAARLRPEQERRLPDPMLSAGWNSSGNPLPGAGLGTEPTANIGLMVTQPLPYPGKRDLRAAIAGHEATAEQRQLEALERDVRSRVKQAYYRLALAVSAADVLERSQAVLDTLLSVTEERYAVGRTMQADVFRAQAELTALELKLERVRHERIAREAELNALLDRHADAPVGRPAALTLPDFTLSLDALLASAARTPMLGREEAMVSGPAPRSTPRSAITSPTSPSPAATTTWARCRRCTWCGSTCSCRCSGPGGTPPCANGRKRSRPRAPASRRCGATSSPRSRTTTRWRCRSRASRGSTATRCCRSSGSRSSRRWRATRPAASISCRCSANFGTVLDNEMSYFEDLAEFHVAVSRLEEIGGTRRALRPS